MISIDASWGFHAFVTTRSVVPLPRCPFVGTKVRKHIAKVHRELEDLAEIERLIHGPLNPAKSNISVGFATTSWRVKEGTHRIVTKSAWRRRKVLLLHCVAPSVRQGRVPQRLPPFQVRGHGRDRHPPWPQVRRELRLHPPCHRGTGH